MAYLADHSSRAVGDLLGLANSTVLRRGADLREWPADELLHLIRRDDGLRLATLSYLTGDAASGDARRVDEGLVESLAALGGLISQAADSLRGDRHCNLDEARRLLPIVREAQVVLASVALDLAAQIQRGAA
ncbi:MAG: hypothetical protein RL030_2775 [Pseudomonadota bacterium]